MSIWRIVRAPVIALAVVSLGVSLGLETLSTQLNRELYPTPPGQTDHGEH
jgi:lipopolysaccharide export system permease protein